MIGYFVVAREFEKRVATEISVNQARIFFAIRSALHQIVLDLISATRFSRAKTYAAVHTPIFSFKVIAEHDPGIVCFSL